MSRKKPCLHAVGCIVLDVLLCILEASLEGGSKVALRAQLGDHRLDLLQGLHAGRT